MAGNFFQTSIPATVSEMVEGEWIKIPGNAIAHNLAGAEGNVDYRGVGIRVGQQAIYDINGNLVASYENMGTYDFSRNPILNFDQHKILDIKPWIAWGNSPYDTTTQEERDTVIPSYSK